MPLRRALILDTETTGLNPPPAGTDVCIEVGCTLFDLELAVPLASFATLIQHEGPNGAEEHNHIPAEALKESPQPEVAWSGVSRLLERADVVLAHEIAFDRGFVPSFIAHAAPWVCSKRHIDWPLAKTGEHLVHLALAHGVGVVHAHRAMTDVDILVRLLMRVHEMLGDVPQPYPLVHLLERAMRPRKKIAALVSFDERELAKTAGFAWEPSTKTWWREVPEDEIAALPFKTRSLENG